MNTGKEFAQRLIENIGTSLELRSRIPDMATLKDLAEGGTRLSSQMLNTSSNFGSFDNALRELLQDLHKKNRGIMLAPDTLPLPLTPLRQQLANNLDLLSQVIQESIDDYGITSRLESIDAAAV